MIKMIIYMILAAAAMVAAGLYGIDREAARQDYLKGIEAENCIFQANCDYYNDMEIRDVEL